MKILDTRKDLWVAKAGLLLLEMFWELVFE